MNKKNVKYLLLLESYSEKNWRSQNLSSKNGDQVSFWSGIIDF